MRAYRTHTCTQIQRLKADRATPHQAINTVRKIQLNNPFTSPVDAFPDRPWHHVSLSLESERPSNHTRRQEQHLPDVLCAAGSPQKASSSYSCDVVVLRRCALLLVPWNDSPSHSTCKIPSDTAQHVCKRGGGVFMLPTDEPPCCDKELKRTHAPFTKWAATQKRAATGDCSSTSRKTVLILMASGVHFTSYFIFFSQVLPATVVWA